MALATNDLNAECACGRALGDHGALDPHPCAASNCRGFRDATLRITTSAGVTEIAVRPMVTQPAFNLAEVQPGAFDPPEPEPEFHEEVSRPIATAPAAAEPSALDDATHGVVVVPDADAAGAMVWWRLSGTTDVEKVNAALAAAGIPEDDQLGEPSAADALRVAVKAQRNRRVIARPLPDETGWVLVIEHADEQDNDLTWATGLRVRRDQRPGEDDLAFDPPDHPARAQIAADYAAALAAQSTGKVGKWLATMARRSCDAIGLRENGGVYFVPAPKVAAWKARVAAVRQAHAGHTFALVPAMRTEDAVAAVVDALTAEAGAEAAALEAEVMAGDLTARSLEHRADRTRALAEKVGRYAQLMGAAMPAVSARLEQLQATIAAATLAARAAEEAK